MSASKKLMRRCHEGKRQFPTLQEAQAAARQMSRRKAKSGAPIVSYLRAYGCACGAFHFGKTRDINWDLVAELSKPKILEATR